MIFLESEASAVAGDGSQEGRQEGGRVKEGSLKTGSRLPWAPGLIPFGFLAVYGNV